MKGMLAGALSPVETTPDQFDTYKRQFVEEVEHLCGGEEVIAAAMFRQGGATGHQAAMRVGSQFGILGGLLAKKAGNAVREKRAGGLPQAMVLAVTARRLYAFDTSYRISARRKARENGQPTEVACWDREALTCSISRSGTMPTLKIEPFEGPAATVVGGSSADDPWSREVMSLLAEAPVAA